MRKTKDILECNATVLVRRLLGKMNQSEIAEAAAIDKAKVSRLAAGTAGVDEAAYRRLAKLAVDWKVI